MTDDAVDPNLRVADLEKVGEGFAGEVYALPGGRVVKLLRDHIPPAACEREAANMRAAARTGVPMPAVFGTVTIEGRHGVVMERLDGTDQLTVLGKKPWKVWGAGKELAQLQARLHSVPADEGLRPIKESLREDLLTSALLPDDLRQGVVDWLATLPDGDRIIHGDFHPGQIIETKDGPRVIDWVNATRGDPLADVSRTVLLVTSATLPPDTGKVLAFLVRFARKVLVASYLLEYRRQLPFDDAALEAWAVPIAAERLLDPFPEERENLLKFIRSKLPARNSR